MAEQTAGNGADSASETTPSSGPQQLILAPNGKLAILNCMGSFSLPEGLWSFPTPVPLLKRGPVGLIFQSGGSLGNWVKGASE